jgi:hypothetical protein
MSFTILCKGPVTDVITELTNKPVPDGLGDAGRAQFEGVRAALIGCAKVHRDNVDPNDLIVASAYGHADPVSGVGECSAAVSSSVVTAPVPTIEIVEPVAAEVVADLVPELKSEPAPESLPLPPVPEGMEPVTGVSSDEDEKPLDTTTT